MIVTLLSDLGTKDGAAATARAYLTQHLPGVTFVDLTHSITGLSQRRAAYVLANAYPSFPKGTIHLSMVFPFAGTAPAMVATQVSGHTFIAPDNGLLPTALGADKTNDIRLLYKYQKPYSFKRWLADATQAIQQFSESGSLPQNIIIPKTLPPCPAPSITPSGIDCFILYSDHYGNVILNISKDEFTQATTGKEFNIRFVKTSNINHISTHYSEVENNTPLCRFNSMGLLEIAVNHGSAIELLGLKQEDYPHLRNMTVHISTQ